MAMASMIVHNIAGPHSPEDTQLLVNYVSYVLSQVSFNIYRAKAWHDHIFRPRYYYTSCSRTLELIQNIHTHEMTRHVILLEGNSFIISMAYLLDAETVVRRIMDAGFCMVWTKKTSQLTKDSSVVFKGGQLEVILEGRPFEQEYVTDFKAFNVWLDKRLPQIQIVK